VEGSSLKKHSMLAMVVAVFVSCGGWSMVVTVCIKARGCWVKGGGGDVGGGWWRMFCFAGGEVPVISVAGFWYLFCVVVLLGPFACSGSRLQQRFYWLCGFRVSLSQSPWQCLVPWSPLRWVLCALAFSP
jgi:hypothetical protein